jgi:hypothetical protein
MKATVAILSLAVIFGSEYPIVTSSASPSGGPENPILRNFGGDQLPQSRTILIILNANTSVPERLKAVSSLGLDLSHGEVTILEGSLTAHPQPQEENLPALQLVKNNVMNLLIDQTLPPAGLTTALIDTCQDEKQDFVSRDYAVQHLVTWYEAGAGDLADAKPRIRTALVEAASANNSIAGTALLGLHRLAINNPGFDRDGISQRALALANSNTTVLPARITALQVCAEEGMREILPVVRSLVGPQNPTALRISAIAALARLGTAGDISLLTGLEARGDEGMRPAVNAALNRLQEQLTSKNNPRVELR